MYADLGTEYEHEIHAPFTDGLTGLFNHGFFQMALDLEIKRSRRYGTPFTLAFVDVDLFQSYNRRHGHAQGDRMLRTIAGLIKKNVRDVDLAARYAGDLYALVLPNSDVGQASRFAERIRHEVEVQTHRAATVSLGLASYPRDAAERESLLRRAREALLQAKMKGKNRIDVFQQEPEPGSDGKSRILVVDDEPRNLKLLEALLLPLDYEVVKAFSGAEALSLVDRVDVDLVLLDVMMPEMDGYEVCRRLKGAESTRMIPIVMVTALDDMQARITGIEAGVDDFITKPPNKMELLTRVKTLVNVKALNSNLTNLESVLFSLANAVEAKDRYTKGHIWRVSELATALGKKMGLSGAGVKAINLGGIIHDIGKIGVPEDILNKAGPLDPPEWEIMKQHPDIGYKICLPLKETLGVALEVVRYHHEKLDGTGFPDGLRGDEIPLAARVMAVVDIYDALVTDRPYRGRMPREGAFENLRQEAAEGKLDRVVVEYFIEMVS